MRGSKPRWYDDRGYRFVNTYTSAISPSSDVTIEIWKYIEILDYD
jgi:hypothetical protein